MAAPPVPMAAYVEEVPEEEIPEVVATVALPAPALAQTPTPALIEEVSEVVAAVAGPPGEAPPAEMEASFEEVPPTRMNPGQIQQVLLNLVLNARHAIDGHGTTGLSGQLPSLQGDGFPPDLRLESGFG